MWWSNRSGFGCGSTSAAIVLFSATLAVAQASKLEDIPKNIELCNNANKTTSPEQQAQGCTGIIKSGSETSKAVAIAHNNRGNAYVRNGDFDRAIEEYDQAIKANSKYAKAFNNRGVAYQKKADYDRAIADLDESIRLWADYAGAFANRAETFAKKVSSTAPSKTTVKQSACSPRWKGFGMADAGLAP